MPAHAFTFRPARSRAIIQIFIFARSRAISNQPRFYSTNLAIAVLLCRSASANARCVAQSAQARTQPRKQDANPIMRIKWYLHHHH